MTAAEIAQARKSWEAVVALQDNPKFTPEGLALAAALWATQYSGPLLATAEAAAIQNGCK